ncbi:fructosamine kinase family protein [Marinimicrobium locisalis]|uniref:fructosamine kinase family protein n=1 Tax=Marinimicrobium locisalis TaxID=546022 RepID=UPI0032215A06
MDDITHWLQNELETDIARSERLSGGDICDTTHIVTTDGRDLCIKQQASAPRDFFIAEATGLAALRDAGTLRVPEVYEAREHFIAMEYIAPARRADDYWRRLGEGLAHMHRQPAPAFGFSIDNYCGRTPQPNPETPSGHEFFAEHRLMYQGRLAHEQGHLDSHELDALERLCTRLPTLIPDQSPSLIHGDLWGGNIHGDEQGHPVLIDPATHWGWAEAELAMTRLFGGFDPEFYEHYLAVNPLEPGWRERVPLYNLYHLLNHLNLFGSSYYPQVIQVVSDYS